jgi:hypothetical protein
VIIALVPPHNLTFFYKLIPLLTAFCELLLILWTVTSSGYKQWNLTTSVIINNKEENAIKLYLKNYVDFLKEVMTCMDPSTAYLIDI